MDFSLDPSADPAVVFYWPPRDPDDLRPSVFSSQYKRDQERLYARRAHPNAPEPSASEESDYYDSGSFASDSDAYSVGHEEYKSHTRDNSSPMGRSGMGARHAWQKHYQQDQQEEQSHWTEEDEDTVPLVPMSLSSKQTKDD
ncbi:hypothetical protein BDF14DRAFT_1344656 [Spinellus fusiger]|nr:hypothetical protein BDF14DRAFT_1344656 [Spinellus fusiger]